MYLFVFKKEKTSGFSCIIYKKKVYIDTYLTSYVNKTKVVCMCHKINKKCSIK